jgi:energy-coupling factor transporter ATP-binding protein EcfA2
MEHAPLEYDFWNIREQIIPFPTPDDGYTRVLFIGSTGAGKTTLVRQLIGTNPKNEYFPSTSSSKTTTCDLEIVLAEGIFRGVVSFLPKQQIQTYVEECVVAAALAQREQRSPKDVERKLLEHNEQRFRLSYILGKTPTSYYEDATPVDEDDEEEKENDELDEQVSTPEEQLKFVEVIQGYVQAVRALTENAGRDLEAHPDFPTNASRQERYAFAQEFFENELYRYEAFQHLVANIIEANV